MKKTIFFSLLGLLLLAGCADKTSGTAAASSDESKADSAASKVPEAAASEGSSANLGALLGAYVGAFEASKFKKGKNPSYSNRINISIDQIVEGTTEGHSVVAGNSRPFKGTLSKEGELYKFEVAEPGDDKYDGKFSFTVDPSQKTLTGTWVANDPNLAVSERKYELKATTFTYNPDLELPETVAWADLYSKVPEPEWQRAEKTTEDVTKFNVSKVKLKKEDIENMYKSDLEILRNSIYARHGYSFKTRKMRYVFDEYVDWYVPVSVDVSKELTKLEEDNIALIKRYEQHAETYYDEFGR